MVDKDLFLRIGKPQNTCVRCAAPLAVTGKHPSALMESDPSSEPAEGHTDIDGPVRHDYCAACWKELAADNFVSFWMARREAPKPRKIQNRKERNTALLSYFESIKDKTDIESRQSLFVLAHLLMKYGVFKWVRSEPAQTGDGLERIYFRNAGTDEVVQIDGVELEDHQIARIKHDIDFYLSQGLPVTEEQSPQHATVA